MKVLVGCEFSGVVRDAFLAKGHDAWSCDLLDSESPGPHIKGNILDAINEHWDLAIFHPPCTHLAVSGAAWFKYKQAEQKEALNFVAALMQCNIPKWCLENPVSIISSHFRKPDQIIQPWMFGHPESKATCLWLKGLPILKGNEQAKFLQYRCKCKCLFDSSLGKYGCPNCAGKNIAQPLWENQTPSGQNKLGPSADRWKLRSRTFKGIATAMADQWG